MARYLLIALNGPTSENDEDAYNDWYTHVHMPELLATPVVVSAERYKVVQGNVQWPYVAIYEIETNDLAAAFESLADALSDFHPAFDRSNSAHIVAAPLS